jgi:DNA-binding NarL/FixJ family response regulator
MRGTLTRRERAELDLLARGLSNAEIARELYLSATTVKGHISRILLKVECANRARAGLLAQHAGLGRS